MRLNAKIFLVDLPGESEAVLDSFIVIAPGVIAQRTDGLTDAVYMLVNVCGNQL